MAPADRAPGPPRVLGMGNLLHGDEGLGVCAARHLRSRYEFSPPVEILDGAVLGFGVLDVFDRPGPVLLLDALAADAPAGALYRIPGPRLLHLSPDLRLAAHEVEPVQQLRLRTALGTAPDTVLIAMVAERTTLGLGFSPAVRSGFPGFVAAVLAQLAHWGVRARAVDPAGPAGTRVDALDDALAELLRPEPAS